MEKMEEIRDEHDQVLATHAKCGVESRSPRKSSSLAGGTWPGSTPSRRSGAPRRIQSRNWVMHMVVRHSRLRRIPPILLSVTPIPRVAGNCIQHGRSIAPRYGSSSHTHTGHRYGHHLPLTTLCSTPQYSHIPLPIAPLRKSKRVSHGGTGILGR